MYIFIIIIIKNRNQTNLNIKLLYKNTLIVYVRISGLYSLPWKMKQIKHFTIISSHNIKYQILNIRKKVSVGSVILLTN